MTDRTITLRSDLVDRLETLAQAQGRSPDDVLGELLDSRFPVAKGNWALAIAQGMEAADIDWQNDPDASERSRKHFEQHLRDKWQRTQTSDGD